MSNFKICIAIPVYNGSLSIERAIKSCINQIDAVKYQILIVDNASTDETSNILKKFENHENIKIITNSATVNLFENHNVALKNADADYVLFCHADDCLEPDAIKTIYKKISERGFPKKYILWGHSLFRDYSIHLYNSYFRIGELFSGQYAVLPFMFGGLTPSGTCYSRNSFVELGGFIKTSTRLEPSDMSTMILAAISGFHFEMIEEMIFVRTQATTMKSSITYQQVLQATDSAILELTQILSENQVSEILQLSNHLKMPPISFYSSLSKYKPAKKALRKILFKQLFKKPTLLFSRPFQILIKRILF